MDEEKQVEQQANLPTTVQNDLPVAQRMSVKDLDAAVASAEKFVRYVQRLIELAVSLTNIHDWVDQGGKPYLEASGCAKVARGFGISIHNVTSQKEKMSDEKGDYFIYRTTLSGTWQGNTVTEIGTCSTRDGFFAKKNNELLPLSEIDVTNVIKKSHTNALNRITKKLLGLSFTWEEIEAASDKKITKEAVVGAGRGVTYDGRGGSKKDDTPEMAERKKKLAADIMEMVGGDKASARSWLKEVTTFTVTEDDGSKKEIKGKESVSKLTVKQVPRVEKAVKAKLAEMEKAVAEAGPSGVEV